MTDMPVRPPNLLSKLPKSATPPHFGSCSAIFELLRFIMPYHVQPLKEFLVRPALPASLNRLSELAYNLVWSWDHAIRSLFRRLEPTLWKESNHNPVLMLGRISQAALDKAAADPRYLAHVSARLRTARYLSAHCALGGRLRQYRLLFHGVWAARLHADLLRRLGRPVRRPSEGRQRFRLYLCRASVCCISEAICSNR